MTSPQLHSLSVQFLPPRNARGFVCSFLLFVVVFAHVQAQETGSLRPEDGGVLQLGVDEYHQIRPGNRVELLAQIKAPGVARLEIDPKDIGLTVAVYTPDGAEAFRAEGVSGAYGTLQFAFAAPSPGDYRIRIEPFEDASGDFTIVLRDLRPSTPIDADWIGAQASLLDAIRLSREGGPDRLRAASQQAELARKAWHELNEGRQEALALCWLGRLQILQSQVKEALATFESAASMWHELREQRAEAQAISSQAETYIYLGKPQKALELYEQALVMRRRIGDRRGEAETLNGIAIVDTIRGDTEKALGLFNSVIATRLSLGDRGGRAGSLSNLANVYTLRSDNRAAAETLEEALALAATTQNRRLETQILTNLARAYALLSDFQKALEHSQHGLDSARKVGDERTESALLNNLGTYYQYLGDYTRAHDYFQQSIELKRRIHDLKGEATVLTNLGWLSRALHAYDDALKHFQEAMALIPTVGDRLLEGNILNNIGDTYCDKEDFVAALENYDKAMGVRVAIGDRWGEVYTRNGFGRAYLGLKRNTEAVASYERAVSLAREIEDRNGELGALSGLAHAQRALSELDKTHESIESALQILETARAKVVLPELRTSYVAQYQDYYDFAVDVLMQLDNQRPQSGFSAKALEMHERGLARSLVETLSEARASISNGVPADMATRERALREKLSAIVEQRIRAQFGKAGQNSVAALDANIAALSRDYEQVESEIRTTSPAYAALTQPVPPRTTEIQAELEDDETVLLEYALGVERSYGWLVSRASVKAFELPPKKSIEALARRYYELLSDRTAALRRDDSEMRKIALELGKVLLGPIAPSIGGKRLVVIPTGALCYVPFEALGDPDSQRKFTPLITRHVISNLPSASVLPLLRAQTGEHNSQRKLVAIVADPVFDRFDTRVRTSAGQTRQPETRDVEISDDSTRGKQLLSLGRLVFSRQEAESIYSIYGPLRSEKLLDFQASLSNVLSPELAGYQMVHFATHGLFDSEHPERSALVLSLFDPAGNPQPGFLKMSDIFNLNLHADLIVLSACQSALGSDIKGEGLVGLTRAFMYAGAKRVVASLWKVDDLATAEMMRSFYKEMARGEDPVIALRRAKLNLMKNRVWSSPYYWAPFTFQGEFGYRLPQS
jgi:CHAT domain-containing protein/Tfp pilus assembly protein PilF